MEFTIIMEEYTTKALYDVIKTNLLLKDRDLIHFIKTMNSNIVDEYKKVKHKSSLQLNDIMNNYENYTIVYMMIKSRMSEAKIVKSHDKAMEITNLFLNDMLDFRITEKPKRDNEGYN